MPEYYVILEEKNSQRCAEREFSRKEVSGEDTVMHINGQKRSKEFNIYIYIFQFSFFSYTCNAWLSQKGTAIYHGLFCHSQPETCKPTKAEVSEDAPQELPDDLVVIPKEVPKPEILGDQAGIERFSVSESFIASYYHHKVYFNMSYIIILVGSSMDHHGPHLQPASFVFLLPFLSACAGLGALHGEFINEEPNNRFYDRYGKQEVEQFP